MRWSVVIPTRLQWTALAHSLPPLLSACRADDEVLVVCDNAEPETGELRDPRLRFITHRGPRGFAPACNAGAAVARGEWLLFLNDDVLVRADTLDRLAAPLARPEVGAVGPDIWSRQLGRSESGTRLFWHHGVLEARQEALSGTGEIEVPYLCGAALAVRRSVFARMGGFEGALAPYFWEDVELSLRIREHVGATVVLADAHVEHVHGNTIGRETPLRRGAVYERNRLLVTWMNLKGPQWPSHLAWVPVRLATAALRLEPAALALPIALWRLVAHRRRQKPADDPSRPGV